MTLQDSIAALAAAPRLLVALDFDGTLALHVDRPEDARALPENTEALIQLVASPGTTVAIVSGRPLEFLTDEAELPEGLLLIGSHGAEMSEGLVLDPDEASRVRRITEELDAVAEGIPGAWVEHKPAGAGLHMRLSPRAALPEGQRAARAAAKSIGGFVERDGKDIVEFSVRADTKGDALKRLRERLRPDATLYSGDDVTDEDAFAVLGTADLALKVGEGPTAAAHRIPSPAELAGVLLELARRRAPLP